AIYGIRPIGALAGGMVAGNWGPQTGLVFVVVAYAASFLAALFSDLRRVRSYADVSPDTERTLNDSAVMTR
ncbi:MAG: hypothetical protein AAFU34_20775, partial [Pseudomonadota bacterium]